MGAWTGVVLALAEAESGGLRSRVSTYLHPLAGRPLAWHVVRCLANVEPGPSRIVVAAGPDLSPDLFADIPARIEVVLPHEQSLGAILAQAAAAGRVVAVDAAAPTAGGCLQRLLGSEGDALLVGEGGEAVAAALGEEAALLLLRKGGDLAALAAALPGAHRVSDGGGFVVRSRAGLSRAASAVRDGIVRKLMEGGVTFLLPETVLVDVDVQIGRDTVIYPGCVLEAGTTIGDETVVGPCCRLVAARVGSGVELKGFNYVSHISVRNRAILEPHVRRGFDE
jgi:bifunctional N-acetylglucosamine-1-phosphate-uridyltransferase/glucosamine-1-phosphate-acetyltransferase GlmU-like protein